MHRPVAHGEIRPAGVEALNLVVVVAVDHRTAPGLNRNPGSRIRLLGANHGRAPSDFRVIGLEFDRAARILEEHECLRQAIGNFMTSQRYWLMPQRSWKWRR